jgi:hypothetical protein
MDASACNRFAPASSILLEERSMAENNVLVPAAQAAAQEDSSTIAAYYEGQLNGIYNHCRPNWTGNGSGDVENKVVDLSF